MHHSYFLFSLGTHSYHEIVADSEIHPFCLSKSCVHRIDVQHQRSTDPLENQEQDEFKGEVVKIHISIGKKKKIRIGDIVGALSNIDSLENSDLGVIKIYDNYSTVDILNQKGKKFLNDYKEIIVKNKKAKIREEK